MRLFLFNPDHDMALAANYAAYIAKAAGRRLMSDMAWLPVCYAERGDAVLLFADADEPNAEAVEMAKARGVSFVRAADVPRIANEIDQICPWGWNKQVAYKLRKFCPSLSHLLPSDDYLDRLRAMSSRRYAAERVLKSVIDEGERLFVGEAVACNSMEEVGEALAAWHTVVAKEPWSGSGRGLRYLQSAPDTHQSGWLHRVIESQGCVMIEPHYQRLADLAAEFYIGGDGKVEYRGLSLFLTYNGQYQGNIIATDSWQRDYIEKWLSFSQYEHAVELLRPILSVAYKGYRGPLGIDMMIVLYDKPRLHPCVEVNLRQTMGHLALSFQNDNPTPMLLNISAMEGYHIEQKPYMERSIENNPYW